MKLDTNQPEDLFEPLHNWSYLQSIYGQETQIWATEPDFIDAIFRGDVHRNTVIASLTRTNGKWLVADQIPQVGKLIQEAEKNLRKEQATKLKKLKKLIAESKSTLFLFQTCLLTGLSACYIGIHTDNLHDFTWQMLAAVGFAACISIVAILFFSISNRHWLNHLIGFFLIPFTSLIKSESREKFWPNSIPPAKLHKHPKRTTPPPATADLEHGRKTREIIDKTDKRESSWAKPNHSPTPQVEPEITHENELGDKPSQLPPITPVEHHEFIHPKPPGIHLNPDRRTAGYSLAPKGESNLYLIRFHYKGREYIKIGKTNRSVFERFAYAKFFKTIEKIKIWRLPSEAVVFDIERKILDKFDEYRHAAPPYLDGYTETFDSFHQAAILEYANSLTLQHLPSDTHQRLIAQLNKKPINTRQIKKLISNGKAKVRLTWKQHGKSVTANVQFTSRISNTRLRCIDLDSETEIPFSVKIKTIIRAEAFNP